MTTLAITNWSIGLMVINFIFGNPLIGENTSNRSAKPATSKTEAKEGKGCPINLNIPIDYSNNGRRLTTWRRVATSATESTSNTWQQGAGSGGCQTGTRICRAQFEDGYDPNNYDYSTNLNAVVNLLEDDGYRPN